jgi:hypothetical protein
VLVEQLLDLPQRRHTADRINAAPQLRTDLTAGHPFRNASARLVQENLERYQSDATKTPHDIELTTIKRVERILDRHNALIAGIITSSRRRAEHPVIFKIKQ